MGPRPKRSFLMVPFCTLALLFPALAFPQSYNEGYSLYVKGDFKSASEAFRAALARTGDDAERARLYKMLGISLYMQGERAEAGNSFAQAKKLNPDIKVGSSEVLDEAILSFFASIPVPAPTPKQPPPATPRPLPSPPLQAPEPAKQVPAYVQVQANIADADIYIDGAFAGKAGALIQVLPGNHEVKTLAKDFRPEVQVVQTTQGYRTLVTVALVKNPAGAPPPPPVEVAKTKPEAPRNKRTRKKPRPIARQNESNDDKSSYATWYYLLPLGTGQFLNDTPGLGALFGGLQAGGVLLGFYEYTQYVAMVNSLNSYINQRTTAVNQLPASQQQAFYNATLAEVATRTSAANQTLQTMKYSLYVAAAAWGVGAIEAYYRHDSQLEDSKRRSQTLSWALLPPMAPGQGFVLDLHLDF